MSLENYISKKIGIEFHSIYGLFGGRILIIGVFIIPLDIRLRSYSIHMNELLKDFFLPFGRLRLVFYIIIMAIFLLIRCENKYYIKKNKENRIGIVIAIFAEKSEEGLKFKNDFIKRLGEQINGLSVGNTIDILIVKNHIAEEVASNKNDRKKILRLHKRTKGHFYLYGSIKKRNINNYYLDLDGFVAHAPLEDENIRKMLKEDFISALPKTISFSESVEMEGFNISADLVFITIKYITGIASLLSGDPYYAISVHKDLKQELDNYKVIDGINIDKVEIDKIRHKLPLLIANELLSIAMIDFYIHRNNAAAQVGLDESLKINPVNYNALIFQSIFEFLAKKDVQKALRATQKARDFANGNGVRRYNQAFLYFRMKNYKKAISICCRIKDTSFPYEEITIQQTEKFTLDLLEIQPDYYQLYFWLGYLNYYKSNNYGVINFPMALSYLEKFEERCNNQEDILLKNKSTAYLRDIRQNIRL